MVRLQGGHRGYGLDEAELLSLQSSSKLLFQETDRT